MNYDTWKTQAPPDDDDYVDCPFCGASHDSVKYGSYCSKDCKTADANE